MKCRFNDHRFFFHRILFFFFFVIVYGVYKKRKDTLCGMCARVVGMMRIFFKLLCHVDAIGDVLWDVNRFV